MNNRQSRRDALKKQQRVVNNKISQLENPGFFARSGGLFWGGLSGAIAGFVAGIGLGVIFPPFILIAPIAGMIIFGFSGLWVGSRLDRSAAERRDDKIKRLNDDFQTLEAEIMKPEEPKRASNIPDLSQTVKSQPKQFISSANDASYKQARKSKERSPSFRPGIGVLGFIQYHANWYGIDWLAKQSTVVPRANNANPAPLPHRGSPKPF